MEKVNCAHSTSMCTKLFLLKTDIRLKMHVQILRTNIFPNANIHTLMQGYWIKIHMDKHIKSQVKLYNHTSISAKKYATSAAFQHCDNHQKIQARAHVPKPFTTAERRAAARENSQRPRQNILWQLSAWFWEWRRLKISLKPGNITRQK